MTQRRVAGTKRTSRSAVTGRYVSKASGARHPRTTIVEGSASKSIATTSRSSITERHLAPATSLSPAPVVETKAQTQVSTGSGKGTSLLGVTPKVRSETRPAARGGVGSKSRSTPADDPLAPERTRWLAEVVGGSGRLAALLGVSASQTSRWSQGQERPSVTVAPLLIDLEHVLARVRLVWADPAAGVWMTSANAYLEGARPIDVLQLSGPGPVLQALDAQAWGGAA